MSPTTRSDSMKKKLQNREAYSRSAKRSLENDFEATTSDAQTEINKVAKRAAKNTNKVGSLKSQKRKRFNVGINTPKITKKPKESEHVTVSDGDFQSGQFMPKKKKRSGIKIGIGRGKFPRETLAVKKTCQFRSTVVTYNPKRSPITEGVRRIISQTPFAAVFECFFGEKLTVSKSNNQMGMILNAYNHKDNTFTFGSTQLQITLRDYADILGMNADGEYILEKVTPPSDFVIEAFGTGKKYIKKCDVASAIDRELLKKPISVIEVQERDHNLARLVLVDICIKFLFANGMGSLDMAHVRALKDLNEISKYAWAKEVKKCLVEKLVVYKTRDSKSPNTEDCAYIILYWLCLKTNIISPIPGREEAVPMILRWDLNVLESLLKKMTFKDICAQFNGNYNEAYGMSMADLIKEVQDSKREILSLKKKTEDQDMKIQCLEQFIEDSFTKSSSGKEGFGAESVMNDLESPVGEKGENPAQDMPETRTEHHEPTFDPRNDQSQCIGDHPQIAMIVGCESDRGGFGSPIHSGGKQLSEEEEFDMLCIQAVTEVEKSVESARNNKREDKASTSEEDSSRAPNTENWTHFDAPRFDLLSDDDKKTPEPLCIQRSAGRSTIIPLDDMYSGMTGASIGLYSYADLPKKRVIKPRNDDIYHFTEVKKRRMLRNNARNKSTPVFIDVDALNDTKQMKIQKTRWNKNKIFQDLLDTTTKKALKDLLEKAPPGESFWQANEMGLIAITSHEIEMLLSKDAVTNTIIDAFSSLLEEEVKSNEEPLPDTKYLLTHAWNAVEDLEALAMHSLIFEPLYEYVGSAQLIIIPLRHSGKCHFTLLTFDTTVPCFFHYDSMNSRQSGPRECFKEAELMVFMINRWMSGVLFQAEEMLRTRERKKLNKRESNNSMLKLDMDYLTEKEILTIKWVQENFKSNFKLFDQKYLVPKQAYGSVDCGVYVMHYMDYLAKEKNLCERFDDNDAIRFRADIVNRFARSARCWRAAQ